MLYLFASQRLAKAHGLMLGLSLVPRGGLLEIQDVKTALVDLGIAKLREQFVIADVTTPLLSLGHLLRAGRSLQHLNDELYLMKGHKKMPVHFRRSSLFVSGQFSCAHKRSPRSATSGC